MATTTNFGWETPDDTDLVKDGAAAMRTLGNSIDTSFVDLKGGTTGQILAKASNTDLDFTWSADAAGIPYSIIDAKGDLIAGTGADTASRLAVGGTNGHVLQVDSTAATGMKWAAAPASNKSYSLISTTSLPSATSVTVSSLSGYDNFLLILVGASSANADSTFTMRFNNDSGATQYTYGGVEDNARSTYNVDTFSVRESAGRNNIELGQMSSNAASTISFGMNIFGGNSTGFKAFQVNVGASPAGGNDQQVGQIAGIYKGSAVISELTLTSSSGNFDAGTLYIYGAA